MKHITLLALALAFLAPGSSFAQEKASAFLGIYSSHVRSFTKQAAIKAPNRYGSYVTAITKGSAAEKIGLQALDFVYGVDNERVNSEQDLTTILDRYQPKDLAVLHYIRNGKKMETTVTFGQREGKGKTKVGSFLGIQNDWEGSRNRPVKVMGAYIGKVLANTNAESMGLKAKDIIVQINQFPLKDWHDLSYVMNNIDPCEPIQVRYFREGKTYVTEILKSRTEIAEDMPDCPVDLPKEIITEEEDMVAPLAMPTKEELKDMDEKEAAEIANISTLEIDAFKVFPNPTSGLFNLTFTLQNKGDVIIRIFSLEGKQVYQEILNEFTGQYNNQLNIGENPAGTYFLQILQNEATINKKIILGGS